MYVWYVLIEHKRFLPEPLVLLLRSSSSSSLDLIDAYCESPELIWTAHMQETLRRSLRSILDASELDHCNPSSSSPSSTSTSTSISPTANFFVRYEQLEKELFVGGVYIRLLLKQPSVKLTQPLLFVEKAAEMWERAFLAQTDSEKSKAQYSTASTALVLGQADLLGVLTSSLICVMRSEPATLDQLITTGFLPVWLSLQLCFSIFGSTFTFTFTTFEKNLTENG